MNILKIKTEKRLLGDIGERAATKFLKKAGYKILERNYVSGDSEIDIICKRDALMAFVEVKTRTVGHESPIEPRPAAAVTQKKQQKIIKAAALYGAYYGKGMKKRLDVIEVWVDDSSGKPKIAEIKHLEGAFDRSDAFSPSRGL